MGQVVLKYCTFSYEKCLQYSDAQCIVFVDTLVGVKYEGSDTKMGQQPCTPNSEIVCDRVAYRPRFDRRIIGRKG